jgi:peptidoglycan/LPS O-acetylase OafA/YrhL
MQQQFYLVWPFAIWFLPRKSLFWFMLAWSAVGPLTRLNHDFFATWWARPEVLTWASFDYFGIGALLALAVHRGMKLESPGLRWISGAAAVGYGICLISHAMGWPTFGMRPLQQTFLAIALCGVIAAGTVGFSGSLGRFLQTSFLQKVGTISYGIYLYHNLAPLVAGKLLWFLWGEGFQGIIWDWVRILSFAGLTWLLAIASWKWIEHPLHGIRSKIGTPNP